jgi:dipeptidyl aminopeptidase/acylaminoacyl peptidase
MIPRRSRACLWGLTLILLGIPATASLDAQGNEPRKWTVDDVLAMKAVSDVAVSPDGRRVAYVVTTRDRESNVNNSDIWVVSTDGGEPLQLTQAPRADRAPRWAADGNWIAFVSDRGEDKRAQVYGIDPSGGEAWQITRHGSAVSSFAISPNGRSLVFMATAPVPDADEELEKQRGRPIVRDSAYANEWTRLWSVTLEGRTAADARPASPDGLHVTAVVWAPDSRMVAFSATTAPTLRAGPTGAVYLQSEPGAEPRRITSIPGDERVEAWPADVGLIVSASGEAQGTANEKLWLVPITGGDPVSLTDALDENAGYVAATPRELWVEASVRTARGLFRIPLAAGKASGAPQRIATGDRFNSAYAASAAGTLVAFVSEASSDPPDVWVSPLPAFAPRRLTTVNPQADGFAHGEQRVVTWKSAADSESIEGVLTLPVGYQRGARVPLLLVIHGGPAGVSSARYPSTRGAYPVQVFSSLGYAVLQPNYRGSTGYGARFRGLNKGDIMGKDWIDVNSGVDELVRTGIADSTKLGIMGWSFGGFHTFWGITQTQRFAAASAGAGANDLTSFYSQTDISEYLGMLQGAAPWDNPDHYLQRSAYRKVKDVTTPLLIQVGESDRRVSPEQSIQFYEAMKGVRKAPVKLVLYPGQGHGVNDPRLSRDLMQRNVAWFTYWVPVTGNKPPVRVADVGHRP